MFVCKTSIDIILHKYSRSETFTEDGVLHERPEVVYLWHDLHCQLVGLNIHSLSINTSLDF